MSAKYVSFKDQLPQTWLSFKEEPNRAVENVAKYRKHTGLQVDEVSVLPLALEMLAKEYVKKREGKVNLDIQVICQTSPSDPDRISNLFRLHIALHQSKSLREKTMRVLFTGAGETLVQTLEPRVINERHCSYDTAQTFFKTSCCFPYKSLHTRVSLYEPYPIQENLRMRLIDKFKNLPENLVDQSWRQGW